MASCAVTDPSASANTGASFSFGVIADVQYADKDPVRTRSFREALGKLDECVRHLNQHDLAFTIQLGDLIDGNSTQEQSRADLRRVQDVLATLSSPLYHVVGNHDFAAGKETLRKELGLQKFYYDFSVPQAPGWRFLVLDGNDGGYGVLSSEQLQWLAAKLAKGREDRETVIVINHFALLAEAAQHHRMNESRELQALIDESPCVVLYLAGHDHEGGAAVQNGVTHLTLCGMVETPDSNAYAVFRVRPGAIQETGYGREPSREILISRTVQPGN